MNNNNKYNTNTVRPVSEFLDTYPGNPTFAALVSEIFRAYHICLSNKANTPPALRFRLDEAANLASLCWGVYNFEYIPRPSIAFIVTVPCPREVVAADFRDRIIHHYIVMKLEPLFEGLQVFHQDVYSCRVGKGNLAAIERLRDRIWIESKGYTVPCYVASFDLQSFFMSIDKRRLYDELVALVQENYFDWDKDYLLYLIRVTTFNSPTEHAIRHSPVTAWELLPKHKSLYNLDWFLGLAIGNLPSQTDANFYNSPFVWWLVGVGLAPVNYVDDFYLVDRDKEKILAAMPHIRTYLSTERGLTLHPRKFELQPVERGFKCLGGIVKDGEIFVNKRTVARCFCKIHWYNEEIGKTHRHRAKYAEKFVGILNSYLGIMSHYSSGATRKKIAETVLSVWEGYIVFDEAFTKARPVSKYCRLKQARFHARVNRRNDLSIINLFKNEQTRINRSSN